MKKTVVVLLALLSFVWIIDAAYISASPSSFVVMENITVRWTNVRDVSDSDWIGVFSPPHEPIQKYLGFQYVNGCALYESGSCSITFELLNMRMPYQFRYIRGNESVAAVSNLVHVKENLPMQGHLQLTKFIREMRVMWIQGLEPSVSLVEYYEKGSDTILYAKDRSYTYTLDSIKACDNDSNAVDNWRDPGQIHDVLLTDLKPSTTYFYRFGDGSAWSPEYSFTTAREVGPHNGINIVTFGDMGTYRCEDELGWCEIGSMGTTGKIWNQLKQGIKYDMVLQIGDISYAVGNAERWDQFFWQIEPIATSIPWMATIGNHEYDHDTQPFRPPWSNYGGDSRGECGIPFFYRFHSPNNDLWWSLDYGNVHFSLLSLEHDFTRGSEQYMWFTKDLATVDRTQTPFLVVGGHRPMYSSGNYTSDWIMAQHIAEELEDLFYKYRVDLAIWGHYHSYERTCPVYKGKCIGEEKGTVHAVIGMAGATLDSTWMEPQPEWSILRDHNHFGLATLHTNSSMMHLKYIADDVDQPLDQVFIHKKKF